MEGGHDGTACLNQRRDALHKVVPVMHVEVRGGLVEKEDRRILRERLRQLNALLLAAGEGGDGTIRQTGQVHVGQRNPDTRALCGRRPFEPAQVRREAERHDLLNRKVEIEGRLLADEGDFTGPLPILPQRERPALEQKPSGVRQKPSQRPEKRGLAAPVGAKEANPAPGRNRERQIVQNGHASQRNVETIGGIRLGMFGSHGNRTQRGMCWGLRLIKCR